MRQVILYPGGDGYWVAEVPSLPGCISQGKSRDEAIVNIREAMQAYLESLAKHDEPVPPEIGAVDVVKVDVLAA